MDRTRPNWLLIKEKDKFARDSSDEAITEEAPNSAASGRTMEEIAAKKTASGIRPAEMRQRARRVAGKQTMEARSLSVSRRKASRSKRSSRSKATLHRNDFRDSSRRNWLSRPHTSARRRLGPRTQAGWLSDTNSNQVRRKESSEKPAGCGCSPAKELDWTARMPDIAAAAAKLSVKRRDTGWRSCRTR